MNNIAAKTKVCVFAIGCYWTGKGGASEEVHLISSLEMSFLATSCIDTGKL